MNCVRCGKELPEGFNYCGYCGASLQEKSVLDREQILAAQDILAARPAKKELSSTDYGNGHSLKFLRFLKWYLPISWLLVLLINIFYLMYFLDNYYDSSLIAYLSYTYNLIQLIVVVVNTALTLLAIILLLGKQYNRFSQILIYNYMITALLYGCLILNALIEYGNNSTVFWNLFTAPFLQLLIMLIVCLPVSVYLKKRMTVRLFDWHLSQS